MIYFLKESLTKTWPDLKFCNYILDKKDKELIKHLAKENVDLGSEILAAKLATEISRFDFAIQIAKIASY